MHHVTCATTQATTDAPSPPSTASDISFRVSWDESDVLPAKKKGVMDKLEQRTPMFARHDWDFSCTDRTEHGINLYDESAFQVKSSQVKLCCSISGNYAHNESSQKYRQEMNRKTNYISMEIVPL